MKKGRSHPKSAAPELKFTVPAAMRAQIDDLVERYPEKRSAVLMVLHLLQEQFGCLSQEAIEWTAQRLAIQPIHVLELATFYPMFYRQPIGKFHFKMCRTLSCALGGSHQLYEYLCNKWGLDRQAPGPQTTADGLFTVEFVECLAGCHTAPTMMLNDEFHENVNREKLDKIIAQCHESGK